MNAPDRQEQESLTGSQALQAAEVMRLQAARNITHCGSGKDTGTLCGLTDEIYTLDTQYNCPACKAICPSFADYPPSDADISVAATVVPVFPPDGYRLLSYGDMIQDGDLQLSYGKWPWEPVEKTKGQKYGYGLSPICTPWPRDISAAETVALPRPVEDEAIDSARQLAAQAWCKPENSHKEMDSDLANAVADLFAPHLRREVSLSKQINELANFIMREIPSEPSRSEGAVDVAIRLLASSKLDKERAFRAGFLAGINYGGGPRRPSANHPGENEAWEIYQATPAVAPTTDGVVIGKPILVQFHAGLYTSPDAGEGA